MQDDVKHRFFLCVLLFLIYLQVADILSLFFPSCRACFISPDENLLKIKIYSKIWLHKMNQVSKKICFKLFKYLKCSTFF